MPDGSPVSKKTKAGPISADRLKSFVERIEKLEEERKAIGGDIRDVYSEAKGVRLRRQDHAQDHRRCARWTPPIATSRKRSSTSTSTRWA